MKTLDEKAIRTLSKLLALREPIDCEINGNPCKVCAQVLHDFGLYRIIHLIFYTYQDDWQFREPEIAIIHNTDTDEYIPSNICYDMERIASNSANIYNGQLTVLNDKVQSDHTEIANNFLHSLEEQL